MCGIIGIFKQEGAVNVELYEGLLMLQVGKRDSQMSYNMFTLSLMLLLPNCRTSSYGLQQDDAAV
jgi:hypothetical protein